MSECRVYKCKSETTIHFLCELHAKDFTEEYNLMGAEPIWIWYKKYRILFDEAVEILSEINDKSDEINELIENFKEEG